MNLTPPNDDKKYIDEYQRMQQDRPNRRIEVVREGKDR